MSLIDINNLTFSYDTSFENIFENVSFRIDTDWKTGFIGRNGRGKTTFLKLLTGEYTFSGTITSSVSFDYYPYTIENMEEKTLKLIRNIIAPYDYWEKELERLSKDGSEQALREYGTVFELYTAHDGYIIDELILKEISKLKVTPDVLERPFNTLSNGERTKLMLCALFLKKNNFLLIDEPTNHLDLEGRKVVSEYLSCKKGFILVSHDRDFLDNIVDHVLSINRNDIEVQKGNYTTWKENRDRQDNYELDENEKLKKDIVRLSEAAKRTAKWSDKVENTKFGTLLSGIKPDKGHIGAQSARMMKRAKNIEHRQQKAIDEKRQLLKNIEQADTLRLNILEYRKNRYIDVNNLTVYYGDKTVCSNVSFSVDKGDRVVLTGRNGCGKSSIIKLLMGESILHDGDVNIGNELIISYVPQDTSFLKGNLKEYAGACGLDESLFKAILRKLDFTRTQFEKDMSEFSMGQKKKVLIAGSLSKGANLFIWDEPLNFMDILSRVQIEELIQGYSPTMVFVEHDAMFCRRTATKEVKL